MKSKKLQMVMVMLLSLLFVLSACKSSNSNSGSAQPANAAKTEAADKQPEASGNGTTSAESGDNIRIGVWEPLTGAMAGGGAQDLEGYQLGNKLRPAVLGKTVDLVIVDNKSDKVEAANSMSRLVEKEKVEFILGTWGSSLALAGIDISEKAEIPTIVAASNLLITDNRYWCIRSAYADPFAGAVVAAYATDSLDAKTAVILKNIAEDYSVTLSEFFISAFKEKTGNDNCILGEVNYTGGDQDFTAQLNTVQSLNPDVIFIPGYFQDLALICIQMKEMGIDIPIVAGDAALAPELISIGGNSVEGVCINAHFSPDQAADNPLAAEFVDAFVAEYGKMPSSDNAVSFTNYNLMLDAIEASGDETDNKAVMEFLRNLTEYPSVTGTINMDPNRGTPTKSAPILRVQNGEFTYVETVNP